jgi:hypothetical protein
MMNDSSWVTLDSIRLSWDAKSSWFSHQQFSKNEWNAKIGRCSNSWLTYMVFIWRCDHRSRPKSQG